MQKKHFEWSSLFQNKQFHTCLQVWTWQTITNHPPSNRNLPIPDNPLAHPFQTCDPRCGEVGPMTWISRHPRKHSRLEVILRVASLGCSKLFLLIEMDSTAGGICNYKQHYNISSGKFTPSIMLILPLISQVKSIFWLKTWVIQPHVKGQKWRQQQRLLPLIFPRWKNQRHRTCATGSMGRASSEKNE